MLQAYRVDLVTGDRWGGEWPPEQFAKLGVVYQTCDRAKSDLYRDFLPLLNSGHIELLDHPRLLAQLSGLERRTARGGRDSIDHAPGAHDDLSNVVAGVILAAMGAPQTGGVSHALTTFDPYAARQPVILTAEDAERELARRRLRPSADALVRWVPLPATVAPSYHAETEFNAFDDDERS